MGTGEALVVAGAVVLGFFVIYKVTSPGTTASSVPDPHAPGGGGTTTTAGNGFALGLACVGGRNAAACAQFAPVFKGLYRDFTNIPNAISSFGASHVGTSVDPATGDTICKNWRGDVVPCTPPQPLWRGTV